MKAKIQTYGDGGKTREITIWLEDDERRFEATINRGWRFGEQQPATVNWPGCGAKNTEITAAFIHLLAVAHRAAMMLGNLTADAFAATTEADVERLMAKALDGVVSW